MEGIVNFIKDHIVVISIIIGLLIIFMYVVYAVFLNKLNKAMHGKTTWMAWVPIINIYLLGKLTIHMIAGIILALASILTFGITWKSNGVETYYSILPRNIQETYTIVYCGIIVVLYVCAHFKLKSLIIAGTAKNELDSFRENNLNKPLYDKNNPIPDNSNNTIETTDDINNTDDDEDNFYSGYSNSVNSNNTEQPKVSLKSISNHENNNTNNIQNP